MSDIKLIRANDSIDDGKLELRYNRGCSSPLGLTFTRAAGKKIHEFGFSMSRSDAKQLALFIMENI